MNATVTFSLLTAVKSVTSDHHRENMTLTAQILLLTEEKAELERHTQELTRDRDRLNWTMGLILEYDTFPVSARCPQKGEGGSTSAKTMFTNVFQINL